MKNILLLSAYDAVSHGIWRRTLVEGLPEYRWTTLTLPPRYFSWRIRGNALSWSSHPALDADYDLVVATSMTDLAALKGLNPRLSRAPAVVYFHENQFEYPEGREEHRLEAQMVTLYSALAADTVVFNSRFNKEGFLQGVETLLGKFPDCVPEGVAARIADRCEVIPVPVRDGFFRLPVGARRRPLTLLWNHRWEYDKGPERLLRLAGALEHSGLDFRLRVAGQQFRQVPDAFGRIRELLGDRILTWGHVDEAEYLRILEDSDVVISTALHDFQGLAVLEAVAAGCIPLVPDRLAYPEWFDRRFRYRSILRDACAEAQSAMQKVAEYAETNQDRVNDLPDIGRLSWTSLRPRYRELLESV